MAFSLAFTQAIFVYILVRDKIALKNYELVPASLITETLNIPKPSVVKILGLMSQAGLIETGTGKKGGVRLGVNAQSHTLLDLFLAIEGQTPLFRNDHTFATPGERPELARRTVSLMFQEIEGDFKSRLQSVNLATLIPDDAR